LETPSHISSACCLAPPEPSWSSPCCLTLRHVSALWSHARPDSIVVFCVPPHMVLRYVATRGNRFPHMDAFCHTSSPFRLIVHVASHHPSLPRTISMSPHPLHVASHHLHATWHHPHASSPCRRASPPRCLAPSSRTVSLLTRRALADLKRHNSSIVDTVPQSEFIRSAIVVEFSRSATAVEFSRSATVVERSRSSTVVEFQSSTVVVESRFQLRTSWIYLLRLPWIFGSIRRSKQSSSSEFRQW